MVQDNGPASPAERHQQELVTMSTGAGESRTHTGPLMRPAVGQGASPGPVLMERPCQDSGIQMEGQGLFRSSQCRCGCSCNSRYQFQVCHPHCFKGLLSAPMHNLHGGSSDTQMGVLKHEPEGQPPVCFLLLFSQLPPAPSTNSQLLLTPLQILNLETIRTCMSILPESKATAQSIHWCMTPPLPAQCNQDKMRNK